MKTAPKSSDEEKRLDKLYSYRILDSDSDIEFDELTKYAQQILKSANAFITLIDMDRQWFKSAVVKGPQECARGLSICSHTILSNSILVIEDISLDDRFADNPFLKEMGIVSYAGAPLISSSGQALGAFCIVDTKPRSVSTIEKVLLETLAKQTVLLFELKKNRQRLLTIEKHFILENK